MNLDLFNLTGKTALVTGGTGYLGTAFAEALADAGASVIISSRTEERAIESANELPVHGEAGHFGIALDGTDEDKVRTGFESAMECTGRIDILVNNGHQHQSDDWSVATADSFADNFKNGTGYFLLARHVRDQAVEQSIPASIVMLGSMYGIVGSYPDTYEGICGASPASYHLLKGGIIHLTRHLAVYWAKDRVRVNCLSPGPFPSEAAIPEMVERLSEKSPMKRMGKPEELKGALLLLASEAGSYMTGQNIIVDGGWTSW